ncbi:hypothetical protein WA158_002801 [Blastocystis sp. Blastoise]
MEIVNDDPVIKECDVYLSQDLCDGLYVLHYPLRPLSRPLAVPDRVRYRPKNEMIELSYDLPHDEHYDLATPEQQRVQEMKLISSRHPAKANYAVGIMKNNALHLTPVRSTLYMRPDISYMNVNDSDEENNEDNDEEEEEPEEEQEDIVDAKLIGKRSFRKPKVTEEEKKKVPTEIKVEFTKKTNDTIMRGPRNYVEFQAIVNDEPWIPVKVHSNQDPESQTTFNRLVCKSENEVKTVNPPSKYIKTLRTAADIIYPDSAVDPEWKSLASPNYPGRVDQKYWKELRNLREQVKKENL